MLWPSSIQSPPLARTRTRRSDSPGRRPKSKFVERLAGGQLGLGAVALEASARPVGEFLFGQLGEVAVVGPAFAPCPVG